MKIKEVYNKIRFNIRVSNHPDGETIFNQIFAEICSLDRCNLVELTLSQICNRSRVPAQNSNIIYHQINRDINEDKRN